MRRIYSWSGFAFSCALLASACVSSKDGQPSGSLDPSIPAADSGAAEAGDSSEDANVDAGVPTVDLSQLGPSCADGGACPAGRVCASYQAANAPHELTCAPASPCAAMSCPTGYQCTELEKEPPSVFCAPASP